MNSHFPSLISKLLATLSVAAGIFLAVLFTEAGQMINLPSDWFYAIYPHLPLLSGLIIFCSAVVVVMHIRRQIIGRGLTIIYAVAIAGTLFIANIFVPEVWLRSQHHSATFVAVSDMKTRLPDDMDMLVLEINGDARAYPRDWMMLPHVAGDVVGGEAVVMTYCALSDLPQAFDARIDGKESDLRVVGQLHNNLVLHDAKEDVLYQQILGNSPRGTSVLDAYPTQRMPWRSFRTLYPEGKVFQVANSGVLLNLLDTITDSLFEGGLKSHYGKSNNTPLFPTLNLLDSRLHAKEHIWGVNINGQQVAFSKTFFEKEKIHNTIIGDQAVVAVWYEDYETFGLYSREINGRIIDVDEVDAYGNTPEGKLQRLPLYPQIFWMVWSHWFPNTKLMN